MVDLKCCCDDVAVLNAIGKVAVLVPVRLCYGRNPRPDHLSAD